METKKKPNVLTTQVGGNHYAKYPIQPVEFIQANKLDFAQGNIVKLVTRFRDKGGAEDLRKIKHYADILLATEYGEDTAPAPTVTTLDTKPDGIYVVFADGKAEKFIGERLISTDAEVTGIAVKQGDRGLIVALRDAANGEDVTLTTREDTTNYYDGYIDTLIDAVADWNGEANTAHLKEIGLNPAIELKEGEHVPSAAEMYLIYTNRKAINAALRFVGGEEIKGLWYLTSTELSATYAWHLYLSNGTLDTWLAKASYKGRVRPVSAFNYNL